MVKYLVDSEADVRAANDCALRWASKWGHLSVVKFLVDLGADVRADNDYAIRQAVEKGKIDCSSEQSTERASRCHIEVVKYLVEKGAPESYLEKLKL